MDNPNKNLQDENQIMPKTAMGVVWQIHIREEEAAESRRCWQTY